MNAALILAIIQLIEAGTPGAIAMYNLIQQNIQESGLPPVAQLLADADATYAANDATADAEIAKLLAAAGHTPLPLA